MYRKVQGLFVYLVPMDNLFKKLFFRSFLLFISFVFLTKANNIYAQTSNEHIYQKLLLDFHAKHPSPFKAIEGRFFRDYLPDIEVDSTQEETLRFEGFSIRYNPLGKKSYLRNVEIPLSLQSKVLRQEVLSYQDTLTAKQVREVIKNSPEPFKGEDPTNYTRWLKPSGLVGGSILAIVGLFFIRS